MDDALVGPWALLPVFSSRSCSKNTGPDVSSRMVIVRLNQPGRVNRSAVLTTKPADSHLYYAPLALPLRGIEEASVPRAQV